MLRVVFRYVKWMMYWIVFALFTSCETFTDFFLAWCIPFYYEIKVVTIYTAHSTLHTAHCTLHTAHCTLHTAHCTLYVHFQVACTQPRRVAAMSVAQVLDPLMLNRNASTL